MQRAEASVESLRAIPPVVLGALLRVPPLSPAAAKLYSLNVETADIKRIASLIGVDPALINYPERFEIRPRPGKG